ncbi:MAG TPA: PAS domain S-box protein [Bacteroidales bacterium]|nr:PAS domain S-box protein [Bacteroidales bacterium]
MISHRQKPAFPWPLTVLFLIIAASSIILGFLYYRNQKERLLRDKQLELSAIADLKVGQIAQWRQERTGDGNFISGNEPLVSQLSEFMIDNAQQVMRIKVINSLRSITVSFDYKSILLLDSAGNVRLSLTNQDSLAGEHLKPLITDALQSRKVILTDLHRTDNISFVHLDLIIPLVNKSRNDTTAFGLLVLLIEPQEILYPLIQKWPLPSKTAESLLIRMEDQDIVYLNELRFLKNSALNLKRNISEKSLPAAMAVQGIESTVDGTDYRGKSVVAAMKKVPGSSWYMVAKVDHDEIFAVLNDQITMVIIIITLFILTMGLLLGFIEWNENVRFYREKYETELDHLALRKHFDYILKYANDIIFLTDRNSMIIEANDRATEIYQYAREELIGLNMNKIRAPETLSYSGNENRNLDEFGFATFEALHTRKDETVFPVEISARKVDIEGVKYYQSICRDITERKQAEETLKESEDRFRKIFEESPVGIAMTGKDMVIIRANSSFCKMTGYSEDELKSFTFRNFTHPDYIAEDEISLLKLVAEEIPAYHTEKQYIRKDKEVIWGSSTVSIIHNNIDEVQYFLIMVEDITERKQAEADLIAAKEKAEESDRLKTAFLHNVSHEIRTPMNAIIGFSALLNEPDNTEEERSQFIDIIFQSGGQLLSIINDIVDIANIESGQVKLNIKEINLNSSLRSLDEQFSYKEEPGILSINLNTGLPDNDSIILTDSTKLIQILSNLINNATKFTTAGSIDFGYVLKDGFLEFFVQDTGIGIPPEHHDKVFDRFYQVDNMVTKKITGTGLGLSICKAYVELLGGRIGVNSTPGEGTTFTFTLPYTKKSV